MLNKPEFSGQQNIWVLVFGETGFSSVTEVLDIHSLVVAIVYVMHNLSKYVG